eukprot:gene11361-12545_t
MESRIERYSDYFDLLGRFRSTVDGLLSSGRSDIWSTYGGLRRATDIIHSMLFDGLRDGMQEGLLKYLVTVNNKQENRSDEEVSIDFSEPLSLDQLIEEYLLSYSTSCNFGKCFIDGDQEELDGIFSSDAFIRQRPCVNLLIMSFNALEQNSLEILSCVNKQLADKQSFMNYFNEEEEIEQRITNTTCEDPFEQNCLIQSKDLNSARDDLQSKENLLKNENYGASNVKSVKRRSLHQDVLMTSALAAVMETSEDGLVWFDEVDRDCLIHEPFDISRNRLARMKEISRSESSLFNEHGHIENEKPHINDADKVKQNIEVTKDLITGDTMSVKEDENPDEIQQLKRSSKIITASFKRGHNRSKSDQIGIPKTTDTSQSEPNDTVEEKLSTSAPIGQLVQPLADHQDYYYQPEDGCMFPKPKKGQSIISYINSRSYDTGSELDKENAHFSICEALITAIEQMKCSKFLDSDSDDSDEEIKLLKQKINERKFKKRLMKMEQAFSDKSTSGSLSTSSFFSGSTFSSSFSSSSADRALPQDNTFPKALSRSWENVSLHSPHQIKPSKDVTDESLTAENSTIHEESEPDEYSAEFVAKSLLKKFDNRRLPRASDLKWMITEEQVPQTLLPLPNAWPISPDDALYTSQTNANHEDKAKTSLPSRLRGTFEWAPPRPQIIFTTHPYFNIYKQLENLPAHILNDIDAYSIEDFLQVKNGELQSQLKSFVNSSLKHINTCQLCKVKGFVCEYCKDGEDILYPFELNRVSTCPLCKTCYHRECFVPEKCPKCERIRARQRLLKSNEIEHT